jgi:hypothetical protein
VSGAANIKAQGEGECTLQDAGVRFGFGAGMVVVRQIQAAKRYVLEREAAEADLARDADLGDDASDHEFDPDKVCCEQ